MNTQPNLKTATQRVNDYRQEILNKIFEITCSLSPNCSGAAFNAKIERIKRFRKHLNFINS